VLADSHEAEDVAQEAFIEAYLNLPKLREPAAFPEASCENGFFVHHRGALAEQFFR